MLGIGVLVLVILLPTSEEIDIVLPVIILLAVLAPLVTSLSGAGVTTSRDG